MPSRAGTRRARWRARGRPPTTARRPDRTAPGGAPRPRPTASAVRRRDRSRAAHRRSLRPRVHAQRLRTHHQLLRRRRPANRRQLAAAQGPGPVAPDAVRRPLDEGVVEHAGEVVLARDARPSRRSRADPAGRGGIGADRAADVGHHAEPVVRGGARVARAVAEEALNDLLVLLGCGPGGRHDRSAGPDRAVGPADPRMGRGPRPAAARLVHIWTVDRHIIETVATRPR